MPYTSNDLYTDILRDGRITVGDPNWTVTRLLTIADQELQESLAPILVSISEGYYLESVDQALTASQSSYTFPQYAMWNKLRRIDLIDSSGTISPLTRIEIDQLAEWQASSTGIPSAFYCTHDKIVVVPAPSASAVSSYTLRMWIYRRPNRLVATPSAAVVSSVNLATGVVTYSTSKPTTFTSSSVHDAFNGSSPFNRVATNITATAAAAPTTQTFSLVNAALLSVGDYVCLRDETVFPNCPIEIVPFLKDLVLRSVARTVMDEKTYQVQRQEIMDRARAVLGSAPGQRVQGQPKKIPINVGLLGMRRRGPNG